MDHRLIDWKSKGILGQGHVSEQYNLNILNVDLYLPVFNFENTTFLWPMHTLYYWDSLNVGLYILKQPRMDSTVMSYKASCWPLMVCLLCYYRFYLPHGLTVDHDDNLWLTDVGSHQVREVLCYVLQCPNTVMTMTMTMTMIMIMIIIITLFECQSI